MAEKKKTGKKLTKKEIKNEVQSEKIVFEKAKKAEEIEEKKEEAVVPSQATVDRESKTLRNLLIILGLLAAVVAFIIILNNTSKSFMVEGVTYNKVQNGQLILYNTKIPVIYNGSKAQYNFYLYNDPRKLESQIPFNGTLNIVPGMLIVMNETENFNCNGDGVIAVANMANLYNLIGKVIKDPTATCDSSGRYVFISIQKSNETSIQQISPACYSINVNSCQILAATERYMVQTFAAVNNITS